MFSVARGLVANGSASLRMLTPLENGVDDQVSIEGSEGAIAVFDVVVGRRR